MESSIIETNEGIPGMLLRAILRSLVVEIGQDFFNKKLMIKFFLCLFRDRAKRDWLCQMHGFVLSD
jgi:hypothetical protein